MKRTLKNDWRVKSAERLLTNFARNDYHFNDIEFSIQLDSSTANPFNRLSILAKYEGYKNVMDLVNQKLPNGGIVVQMNPDNPRWWAISFISKLEIAHMMSVLVEVWEANTEVRFPRDMLAHMSDFLGCDIEMKSEIEKLIVDGKHYEALEKASKVISTSLCFELAEFALEKNMIDLAVKFYKAVPEYANEYREAALTRISEIQMHSSKATLQDKFIAEFEKAQLTGDQDDSTLARRLLANFANIPLTTAAPFSANLNSTTIICELATSHSAVMKENTDLKAQVAELQKQVLSLQSQLQQRQ